MTCIINFLVSSLVGLLLMLLGRREESIAVAESVAEGVVPLPAITRVMPLSWTATLITSVGLTELSYYILSWSILMMGESFGAHAAAAAAAVLVPRFESSARQPSCRVLDTFVYFFNTSNIQEVYTLRCTYMMCVCFYDKI